MSPELYLSIMAIIVSVASAFFILLELGMKMGVEYREQEVTLEGKKKIDDKLKTEFSEELTNITEIIVAKEESNEALKERILGLARMDYYSDFAKRMLDRMTTYNSQFLKGVRALVSKNRGG